MRFYQQAHEFYCGIDLHSNKMYLCVVDQRGDIQLHKNFKTRVDVFLAITRRFRQGDFVVGVESTYNWYWLADVCVDHQVPFVLGHALGLRAVHGGKTKNDRLDSEKLALLLRGGNFPVAYVYPREHRATRDLVRRRTYLVRRRAELMTHVRNTTCQYNLPIQIGHLQYAGNRAGLPERFGHPSAQQTIAIDCALIESLTTQIGDLEKHLTRQARLELPQPYYQLLSMPGVGRVLALVLLYEIGDIRRFPRVGNFLSYCRLVAPRHESNGKLYGSPGRKQGNAHLKWAFSEVATMLMQKSLEAQDYVARLAKKHGKRKAVSILTSRIGRVVYQMLKRGEAFELKRFFNC